MSHKISFPLITAVSCLFLMTFCSTALAFFISDLAGTWYGHHVVTGDAPGDDPRWGYGTLTVDTSGNYTANWSSPSQSNEISSGAIQFNLNGIFTIDNQPLARGVMNNAKDQMVFIDGTPQSGGHALTILNKRNPGTTFSTGDLEGTWYGHHVVSGDRPGDDPRWGYGTVVITNTGSYTATWTSPTQVNEVTSGIIQLGTNGIFTINAQTLTHGVMNDNKNQMVFIDGTPQSSGNALTIFTKRVPGTNFSLSDLQGAWYGHQVVSGDAPADDPRWGYGTVVLDDAGNYTASWNSPTSTDEVTSGAIQLNADGIMTINNEPLTHGVLNDSKDQFVLSDGSAMGNGLMIFSRYTPHFMPGTYYMLFDFDNP